MTKRDEYREGRRFILCDLLWDYKLLQTPLVVLDIGARNAFADTRWTGLPTEMVQLHGFEPDPDECKDLNATAKDRGYSFKFHSVALAGHSGDVELFQYSEPAANSLYPANPRVINRWCYKRSLSLASQFRLVKRSIVKAMSLADWARQVNVDDVDFCKLNVQGAELEILKGAGTLLNGVVGIVAEQSFNETYIGAPLFGEVYEFLRHSGFTMFDIIGMNLVGRTRSPIHLTEDGIFSLPGGAGPRHQVFEGHFLYLRDPILAADEWSANSHVTLEKALKLVCMAEVFGQVELAFELLVWLAASPQIAQRSAAIGEIIDIGAAIYRQVSNPIVPSEEETIEMTAPSGALSNQPTEARQLKGTPSERLTASERRVTEAVRRGGIDIRPESELETYSTKVKKLARRTWFKMTGGL